MHLSILSKHLLLALTSIVTNANASIDSLETATGGDTTALLASVDSLEALAGTIQSDVDDNEADADASIDSLETLSC